MYKGKMFVQRRKSFYLAFGIHVGSQQCIHPRPTWLLRHGRLWDPKSLGLTIEGEASETTTQSRLSVKSRNSGHFEGALCGLSIYILGWRTRGSRLRFCMGCILPGTAMILLGSHKAALTAWFQIGTTSSDADGYRSIPG